MKAKHSGRNEDSQSRGHQEYHVASSPRKVGVGRMCRWGICRILKGRLEVWTSFLRHLGGGNKVLKRDVT